jgi:hypothetical protein
VGVEVQESEAGFQPFELDPGCRADAVCIPGTRMAVGRLAQPEPARIDQAQALRVPGDGGVLVRWVVVVGSSGDVCIAKIGSREDRQVFLVHLLEADQVGCALLEQAHVQWFAVRPTVRSVIVQRPAGIVGHDGKGRWHK